MLSIGGAAGWVLTSERLATSIRLWKRVIVKWWVTLSFQSRKRCTRVGGPTARRKELTV